MPLYPLLPFEPDDVDPVPPYEFEDEFHNIFLEDDEEYEEDEDYEDWGRM